MRISTREVEIAGISPNINGTWMLQMARNLTTNDNVNLDGEIECRERLGGLLKFYTRTAA